MKRDRRLSRDAAPSTPAHRRRRVILAGSLLVILVLIAVSYRACLPPPSAEGASVLLVTIDTLRADHVGAYGARQASTPYLDALANRGVLFEEALASVPLTLPSHSTILSGLEPPHHGVRDNGTYVFPEGRETLATLLKARGYATGAFVGAYVLDRRFGLARGFDVYDDRIDRRAEGASVLESERSGEAVVKEAAAWIGRQQGPFLAWVHLYDPHAPYDPPSPYREQHAERPYDGEIAYADACMGRLLAAAEAQAKERLLIAVTGDHGEGLGEHGERTHGLFVYQPTLRVPLILAGPRLPSGQRRPGPARTADILPTLLARLNVPAPTGLDGQDLLAAPAPKEAYAESAYPLSLGWAPLYSFRRGSLKYIDAPRPELYDLEADPAESRNLLLEREAEAGRLREALTRLRGSDRPALAAPTDPEVAERLRSLGYVAGQPAPASTDALKDPKDALPLWQFFEEANWAEARGEREKALAVLRDLTRREPTNASFRRSLAAALRRAGRTKEAVAVLEDLESVAPQDALAWHERSVALAEAGRTQDAIRAEERAIALNPLLPEAHNHLGILEAGRGRTGEALRSFDTATRLDPNNARAHNNRGNALRVLGRPHEAQEAYLTAARLAPRDPDPLNGLGVLAVQAGQLDQAVEHFRQVLRLDPGYAEARLNLAVAESRRGHVDVARAELEEMLKRPLPSDLAARARGLFGELKAQ